MNMGGGQLLGGAGTVEEKSAAFPSVEWFEKLAEVMQENEAFYRQLGPIDCTMVVIVDDRIFELVFLGYGVESVHDLFALSDAAASHFTLEGSLQAWCAMIDNIRENGSADLEHTLGALTFCDAPLRVGGPDQLEIDVFYRFNATLQRFFNDSAEIQTTY